MNRKLTILVLALIIAALLPYPLSAAEEDALTAQPAVTYAPPTAAPSDEVSSDPEACICGRPYYTEDEPGHMKYECMGCGELISNCVCDCWCGSEIITRTETDGTIISVCATCGNRCHNCTCGNMEAILNFEQLQRDGMVSTADAPKPTSALVTVAASIILFAVCAFMMLYYAMGKDMETRRSESEAQKRMSKHKDILKKIEGQAQGIKAQKNADTAMSICRRENAEQSVKWPTDQLADAAIAMELVNEIQFAKRDDRSVCAMTLYIMHSSIDQGRAKLSAMQGEHGQRLKELYEANEEITGNGRVSLDPAKELFEPGFFDRAEEAFKSGDEHMTLRTVFELKALACDPSVKIGNAEATARQWADAAFEDSYISRKKDYEYGKRFGDRKKAGE